MVMVSVVYWQPTGSSRLAWSKGRQPPGTVLHSSHEPGELLQCFKHDDSTIKIIPVLLLSTKPRVCPPMFTLALQ